MRSSGPGRSSAPYSVDSSTVRCSCRPIRSRKECAAMNGLTLDDLLPLHEYAGRRREFFEAQGRYLDRYRRVRVGPRVTLLFENRQTLWFRLQELLRVARLSEPGRV